MNRKYNSALISNAKSLRKSMTMEERRLWYDCLRLLPQKFVRQKVLGKYIADFYCASKELVIEVDGSQHYEEGGSRSDRIRTEYLEGFGLRVIRIPNNEISRNFRGVCEYIDSIVNETAR